MKLSRGWAPHTNLPLMKNAGVPFTPRRLHSCTSFWTAAWYFALATPSAAQLPDPARRHTACRDTPRTSPARRRTALPRAISAILDADCQVESRGERALPSRGIWKGVRLGLPGPPCRRGIGSLRIRRWSLVLRQVPEPELRPLAPQLGTPAAPQGA